MTGSTIIELDGLTRYFGGVLAVNDVNLKVAKGQIMGLIGPNGAGKTTLFNLISGLLKPDQGSITFHGRNITGLAPHQITKRGIARTFQNVRIFERMSVLENVMVGCHARTRAGLLSALFKLPLERREERKIREKSQGCLQMVGLAARGHEPAGGLPFGLMRYLEVARAMASEPSLLLLDEPAAGLNRAETEKLAELVITIRGQGLAVILVEHDMRLVMEISDRVAVLDQGAKIAEGSPREVQNDPKVVSAYLGEEMESGLSAPGPEPEAPLPRGKD